MFLGNLEVISSSENGYFDVLVLPAGEEENDYAYNITIHVNVTGYEEGSTHLTEVKVFRINKNIQSEIPYTTYMVFITILWEGLFGHYGIML